MILRIPGSQRKLPAVLVVDDELRSLEALRRTLEEDFKVFTRRRRRGGARDPRTRARSAASASCCATSACRARPACEFLREVRERWPDTVRIILSGYTDAEDIIAGVNEAGIWQYLLKPWQPDQLLLTLQRAAEVWRLQQENQRLSLELRTAEPVLATASPASRNKAQEPLRASTASMRAPGSPLERRVRHWSAASRPTTCRCWSPANRAPARRLLARAIHYAQPTRRQALRQSRTAAPCPTRCSNPNCSATSAAPSPAPVEDRIGLFQQADGGTLFLDEIGETSPAFQVKLLRVLQEGEFRPLGSNASGVGRCAGHRGDQPRS